MVSNNMQTNTQINAIPQTQSSSKGGRGHSYKTNSNNQASQLQLSQPNLITFQQIDTGAGMAQNYNSQPATGPLTNTNGGKRNFSNSGRINFGQNNALGSSQNNPKFKQMLNSQGSGEVMAAP